MRTPTNKKTVTFNLPKPEQPIIENETNIGSGAVSSAPTQTIPAQSSTNLKAPKDPQWVALQTNYIKQTCAEEKSDLCVALENALDAIRDQLLKKKATEAEVRIEIQKMLGPLSSSAPSSEQNEINYGSYDTEHLLHEIEFIRISANENNWEKSILKLNDIFNAIQDKSTASSTASFFSFFSCAETPSQIVMKKIKEAILFILPFIRITTKNCESDSIEIIKKIISTNRVFGFRNSSEHDQRYSNFLYHITFYQELKRKRQQHL